MIVQETCSFDLILQLVTNGIAAHAAYRNAIQSSEDIFQWRDPFWKNTLNTLQQTSSILQDLPLFSEALIKNYTRGIKRLNANYNATHLTEYLFKNELNCVFTKSCLR